MQDFVLICAGLWLGLAVLTAWIASRKGLNGVLYFFFGIMAGAIPFVIVGVVGGLVGACFAFLFTVFQPSNA